MRRLAAILTALALAFLGCRSGRVERPIGEPFDVQGHRGARGLLPENTLAGFELALELGVTTLELDLGVTRDRAVVVSHDPAINSKVCRGGQGRLLRDLELDEVQAFDCGQNPDPGRFPEPPRRNVPGARIPTLAEVFDLAEGKRPGGVAYNVEIKFDPEKDDTVPLEELVALVVDLVRERGLGERVTVQSFDWRALELVKGRDPEITTAALLSSRTVKPTAGTSAWLNGLGLEAAGGTSLGLLRAASAYVDVFSPEWRLVTPGSPSYLGSTVTEIREAGFPVVPWTVNARSRMQKVIDLGVDGLISDYPDVLLDLLRERGIPVR